MSKPKVKEYHLFIRIEKIELDLPIMAESLEDAIARGRELKFGDVMEADYSVNDYDGPTVTGVWS